MKRSSVYVSLCLALVFGAGSLAHAGLIVKQKERNENTHKTTYTTLYVEGNRMAARGSNGTGFIFDGDSMTSWNYDTRHKMYMKVTAAQMKAMMKKTKAMADKMMREELKHMSPKMRKQVLAEMKKQKKGPSYKRTGPMRKVGKWRCTPVAKYSSSGELQDSMCIATFKELGIVPSDLKVLKAMNRFEAASGTGGDCDSCSSSGVLSPLAQKQLGLNGMPVVEGDNFDKTTTLSVRHGHVPDSVFKLPKGLKERKMFGM